MKLKYSKHQLWCVAIILFFGGCSRELSKEELMILQLYKYLDSCSMIEGNIIPSPPILSNRKLDLVEVMCFDLTTNKELLYNKVNVDSIQSIRNCHLVLEGGVYYVEKIPEVDDTCYWRPTSCSIKKETNFPDQYLYLKRNTRTSWEQSKTMWLYDSSKYAYEWYCKLAPFPCVDSTFLDKVKGESIEIICFHDYTHCYMIGADSIPRYIDQVKSAQ